jgi:polysaccharide export outer membrane protein
MKTVKFIATVLALIWTTVAVSAQEGYRVRAGDTLSIEVLQDPALNRQALVLPDGRFSFPFAGTLTASGRTISQIETALSSSIAANFNSAPDVFISVTPAERRAVSSGGSAAPATIDVFFVGEVGAPGPKSLPIGTTILQALSTSGGFTNFAATKRVQLRRSDQNGLQSVYEINYDALEQGALIRNDVALQDGDVILVPERRLFE